VGLALSFLYYPYISSFTPAPFLFGFANLSLPPILALEGLYAASGRIQMRKLPWVFALGIAATVVSALYYTPLEAAGPCGPAISGGGLPLPWYFTFTQYTGPTVNPYTFTVDPTRYSAMWASFAFLFDTIFFAALVLARDEIYKWAKGKRLHPKSDLPESPEKSPRKQPRDLCQ